MPILSAADVVQHIPIVASKDGGCPFLLDFLGYLGGPCLIVLDSIVSDRRFPHCAEANNPTSTGTNTDRTHMY